MRILIDGIIFGRQIVGGISKAWEELLRRLPLHSIEVELLAPFRARNYSLRRIISEGHRIKRHRDFFYWPLRYFERVRVRSTLIEALYLAGGVHVFHSTYLSTLFSSRVKKVVTIYDMIPERLYREVPNRWVRWGIELKKAVLDNADAIVTISENTKIDLLRIYPHLQQKRVHAIHLGYSPEAHNSNFDEVTQRYGLDRARNGFFLFVGNRSNYKNFEILISLVETSRNYRDSTFVCVGPPLDPPLKRLLEAKGLLRNFVFPGYVPEADLATLYENACAFVFPSKYEGFGLPILEAMAHGCPVVCSNSSVFPEVAGTAGFYFDPNSVVELDAALQAAVRQDRNEYAVIAARNVQRFSWDRSARQLVQVYQNL